MGELRKPKSAVRFAAVSGLDQAALDWASQKLGECWGPVLFFGTPFVFEHTEFYRRQMGDSIIKQFLAFETLIDQSVIVDAKLKSNDLEKVYCQVRPDTGVDRPINIDPGYVTEAKLVLATTKDRDHRIYLDRGILAEVTLFYQGNRWNASRWTYADYQSPNCHEFLDQCRGYLRKKIQESPNLPAKS